MTLFSEWIYHPFQITGLIKSLENKDSEAVRLTFSVVASSCTFSDFSKQRWVICNFSSKVHLGFIHTP